MVGRLRQRVAMLLTARLIDRARLIARRHLQGRDNRRRIRIDGTHVRCHRQLLEQQAQKRDQRNPATVAVMTKSHEPDGFQ